MELIMQVLNNLFSIHTLVICTLGTVAGVVLGAIPGMNGGIGIAVMLPFTYSMRPEQGLLFLGGIYLGSSYGGSISGILINCPGTAEASCTALEGYPMTHSIIPSSPAAWGASSVSLYCFSLRRCCPAYRSNSVLRRCFCYQSAD